MGILAMGLDSGVGLAGWQRLGQASHLSTDCFILLDLNN